MTNRLRRPPCRGAGAAERRPPQGPDGQARLSPVDISANEMEILDAEKKAIFRGAVDATRGTTNLKADALTVTYAEVKQPDGTSKTDATDLDAQGNVTIKTPGETITGDWARFDPPANQLVVGGGVKLVRGDTVLTGNELRADLNTDMSDARATSRSRPRARPSPATGRNSIPRPTSSWWAVR